MIDKTHCVKYHDSMSKRKQGRVGEAKSEIVRELPLACSNEQAAVEFFERMRWGDCPACPRCGDTDVYQMRDRKTGDRNARYLWRCRGCKQQFTVRIGTVLEESRIPLRHWAFAFWAASSSKKGVSALQIQRQTGLSYRSALFLLHRIRFAMAPTDDGPKLDGTVEVDETYFGGKPRYCKSSNPRGTYGKQAVIGLVSRGGEVRARVIPDVTAGTLKQAVREHVDKAARIMTDEHASYRGIGAEFDGGHEVVTHSAKEYVRGDVTTNTIESFFAILKRGVNGVYHNVSRQHLQRYLDEFEFRYNTRKLDDGERTQLAIKGAEGKRLTYREPVRA